MNTSTIKNIENNTVTKELRYATSKISFSDMVNSEHMRSVANNRSDTKNSQKLVS